MNVYLFRGGMLCEDCGRKIMKELDASGKRPENPGDECSYDSDEYPKGPFPDGGGGGDYGAGDDAPTLVEVLHNPGE